MFIFSFIPSVNFYVHNCDPFTKAKWLFCGSLHKQSSFFAGFLALDNYSFHTFEYMELPKKNHRTRKKKKIEPILLK